MTHPCPTCEHVHQPQPAIAWRDDRQMAKFQRPHGGRWSEENFPCPR